MSTSAMIIFIILSTVTVSYAWGMRGSIIGGEKGAMLPGAMLGLLFAAFSGSEIIRSNFAVFAAVGAAAMFFGGTMTYADTLSLTFGGKKGNKDFNRGMHGLFAKGWCWFGVAGGFMAMALVVSTGRYYTMTELIIFFALAYPIFKLGILLFNRPYNKERGKYPRLYFSKTRKESWGGLCLLLVAMFAFMIIKGDRYSIIFCFFSGLVGGVGWMIAQLAHVYTMVRMKNGKYFFGKFQEKRLIDNWKIMECMLGAFVGLGMSLIYCLMNKQLGQMVKIIETNGKLWSPFEGHGMTIAIILLAVWLLNTVREFIIQKPQRSKVIEHRKNMIITEEEYKTALTKATEIAPPKWYRTYVAVSEEIDFFVYALIPILLSMFGCRKVAEVTCVFMVYWVLTEQVCFTEYLFRKDRNFIRLVMMLVGALMLAGTFLIKDGYSMLAVWLFYCISYELVEIHWLFRPARIREHKEKYKGGKELILSFGSRITVEPYFILTLVFMIVFGVLYLR